MSNVMVAGYNASLVVGTIATNGTLSEMFDLSNYSQLALLSDNASNGTLNFMVAGSPLYINGTLNDTFRLLRDTAGAAIAYTLPNGSGAFRTTDLAILASYRYVRLLTSVSQANTPTFTFVTKS